MRKITVMTDEIYIFKYPIYSLFLLNLIIQIYSKLLNLLNLFILNNTLYIVEVYSRFFL